MKTLIASVVLFAIMALLTIDPAIAQTPGLPTTPDQAPIDGGLGLLAVAGGAYAIKRLRRSKS